MPDSLDNARPLAPLPADTDYRVMPRVREQDRERRFDSLFQEQQGNRKKPERELEQTAPVQLDTFERHDAAPLTSQGDTGKESKSHLGQNLDISA
ncbi:MAG: hypothetical protein H5U38_12245 [Calditrichaeota bacterium]|nr:hypothetical protein [Calditrichota bacterium]